MAPVNATGLPAQHGSILWNKTSFSGTKRHGHASTDEPTFVHDAEGLGAYLASKSITLDSSTLDSSSGCCSGHYTFD
eukprot:1329450-Amphidinium_carterae.1